jgi:hypothetical protein
MKKLHWFERSFQFGISPGLLPFCLERLEGTIYRIQAKVKGKSEATLSRQLDGKWSIKENIGHLAEVDEIALKRIAEMIQGEVQLSPAVFEPRQDYNKQDIDTVIAYFISNRNRNLDRYKSLADADLGKASLHPRLKVMMNPVDLAYFDAEHDDHHLVRINEILAAVKD